MKEIWKDIPNYEGHYQISNFGRVKSLDRYIISKNGRRIFKKGSIQKLQNNGNGYIYKQFKKDGKYKNYYIHNLVMLVFVGERPNNYFVCHIDGDKNNNRLDNLKYDTPHQNNIDQFRHNGNGIKNTLPLNKVLEIRKMSKEKSIKEICDELKLDEWVVSRIKNNENYTWLNDDGSIKESNTSITFKK